jgi:hypothetical protein
MKKAAKKHFMLLLTADLPKPGNDRQHRPLLHQILVHI